MTKSFKHLLCSYAIVGEQQVTAKEMITVVNPYDKTVIGEVPKLSAVQVKEAIATANKALPIWQKKTAKQRSKLLRQWFELIMQNQDALAHIMTLEQGKPLAESKGEIIYAASFIEWFAEEAKRIYGDVIPSPFPQSKIIVTKQPVGVCAAITPWNFPAAMITRKAGAALAAGCTMVIKPASQTPFSALALGKLAIEAGIPAGVLNVVTGDAKEIGAIFCTDKTIRKLSFTGSTEIGKQLMKQSSDSLKRLSFELGGNAPLIVLKDADIAKTVKGIMASKFRNMGQTCVCANRIFVHQDIYETLTHALKKEMQTLIYGNGMEPKVDQGPLINDAAIEKVERLINDATQKGAKLMMGGKRQRQCFEPTLLIDVSADMDITQEEIFGPVATLIKFSSTDEVIKMANDTPYGLASYIFSEDLKAAWNIAEQLEQGMVAINEGILSTEVAPFGGVKESGFGREGSYMGIEEYLNTKYLLMG